MTIRFQGIIAIPLRVVPTDQPANVSTLVSRLDLSFANFLRAVFPRSTYGGPHTAHLQPPTEFKNTVPPSDWFNWAYILMQPRFWGRIPVPSKPNPDPGNMINMFNFYQLFRHVKTSLQVLNTIQWQGGPAIVASLLSQDSFFKPVTQWDVTKDGLTYLSFAQLTAQGAPWAFRPGERSVKRGLFNHHSFKGSNDPVTDPWLPFQNNLPGLPASTQIDRVFAQLFLAGFIPVEETGSMLTAKLEAKKKLVQHSWALVRVKSSWQLGNARPYKEASTVWPDGRYTTDDMEQ